MIFFVNYAGFFKIEATIKKKRVIFVDIKGCGRV